MELYPSNCVNDQHELNHQGEHTTPELVQAPSPTPSPGTFAYIKKPLPHYVALQPAQQLNFSSGQPLQTGRIGLITAGPSQRMEPSMDVETSRTALQPKPAIVDATGLDATWTFLAVTAARPPPVAMPKRLPRFAKVNMKA